MRLLIYSMGSGMGKSRMQDIMDKGRVLAQSYSRATEQYCKGTRSDKTACLESISQHGTADC